MRPLHPPLPEQWTSRPLRLAMSEADWSRLDRLAQQAAREVPTQARAYGLAITRLMDNAPEPPPPGPLDWLDWERRKTLRLLMPGAHGPVGSDRP